jgi:hypothetical protein
MYEITTTGITTVKAHNGLIRWVVEGGAASGRAASNFELDLAFASIASTGAANR